MKPPSAEPRRRTWGAVIAARALAIAAAGIVVGLAPASATAEAEQPACAVVDVQYDVSANLRIDGTTMGAGDGMYRVGPGKVVLRFRSQRDRQDVTFLKYDLRQDFTVVSKALFWSTQVVSRIALRAEPAPRGPVAEGTLEGHSLLWKGRAQNVHSDGTLTCEGSMCGKFGAPPPGISEVHVGPTAIELGPFEFSADMKTFAMPFALLSASDAPKQRTLVSIAGREAGRTCASDEASN
jgi:hypothetical protein